jgi:multimeric flavodoxin WrbA
MNVLFINASPNKDGNTARLAREVIGEHEYSQLDLVDKRIYGYGQAFEGDQFDEVLDAVKAADTIVIGSPVYWHNMSGMLRNVLDRFYGPVEQGSLAGKRLFFVFQGMSPTKEMLDWGEYTMNRFAGLYGMEYQGMATNEAQARALAKKL